MPIRLADEAIRCTMSYGLFAECGYQAGMREDYIRKPVLEEKRGLSMKEYLFWYASILHSSSIEESQKLTCNCVAHA